MRRIQTLGSGTLNKPSTVFNIVESLSDEQITQLHALIRVQWWGGERSLADVQSMVNNSNVKIGLVESNTDQLVAFCRALSDGVFRATIYDVMVAESYQGMGLGKV